MLSAMGYLWPRVWRKPTGQSVKHSMASLPSVSKSMRSPAHQLYCVLRGMAIIVEIVHGLGGVCNIIFFGN